MVKTKYILIAIGLLSLIVLSGCINQSKVRCERSGGQYESGSSFPVGTSGGCHCPSDKVEYNSQCLNPEDDPCTTNQFLKIFPPP